MAKDDDREAKAAAWLQRLREAAAAKEPLVEYARRHGLKPGEAYRWRQNLRRAGRWPAITAKTAIASPATVAAATPRFARVRIARREARIIDEIIVDAHTDDERLEVSLSS